MPPKKQSEVQEGQPVNQILNQLNQLDQETTDWLANQTSKIRKDQRHNAFVETKRMKLQEDRIRTIN